MSDWDVNSPQLAANLTRLLQNLCKEAPKRQLPTIETARQWHREMMDGLIADDSRLIGSYRGEAGLERVNVRVGSLYGIEARNVKSALFSFESELQQHLSKLDKRINSSGISDAEDLKQVVEICAWAHGEWVRIHPFANGNGRTGRIWANLIALRYGLPPFVRLRPRPEDNYGSASAEAMQGDWSKLIPVFEKMLADSLKL